jgi:hypothetical protein
LGERQLARAALEAGAARVALVDEALKAVVDALGLLGRQGTRDLKAHLRLDMARYYWERAEAGDQANPALMHADAEQAAAYAGQAVEFFTKDGAPEEYRLATKLQRDAQKRLGVLEASATPPRGTGSMPSVPAPDTRSAAHPD